MSEICFTLTDPIAPKIYYIKGYYNFIKLRTLESELQQPGIIYQVIYKKSWESSWTYQTIDTSYLYNVSRQVGQGTLEMAIAGLDHSSRYDVGLMAVNGNGVTDYSVVKSVLVGPHKCEC